MDIEAEQIGIVTKVDTDAQVAYVEPDPGVAEAALQAFGLVTDLELRVAKNL